MRCLFVFITAVLALRTSHADVPSDGRAAPPANVASITTAEIKSFDVLPPEVRNLIKRALDLTTKNLTYTFGSADPARGGMDCSGTIYHLLTSYGIKDCPRQSDEIGGWVRDRTVLHLTSDASSLDHARFFALAPGDLVFWSGTYAPDARRLPITHVMLYLGRRAKDDKPLIFGGSDGRTYDGQRRCGVSVFDLAFPKPGGKAWIYGYGPIPGLVTEEVRKPAATPAKARR